MREIIARLVCLLTIFSVVVLSLVFASVHNPDDQTETPEILAPPPAGGARVPVSEPASREEPVQPPAADTGTTDEIARGRAVYGQQNCATCHSIAGNGNPRYPLDGVGENWNPGELEEWVTGSGAAAEVLPAAIAKRKQRYLKIPADDMKALIAYLASLR
jgi:mono/diheme cytochrome c family protein